MTFNACPPESVNLPAAIGRRREGAGCSQTDSSICKFSVDQSPSASGGQSTNVLGEPLQICGCEPLTGWYRDGSCRTDANDTGRHTVCCVISEAFLRYTRSQGNDLSTPAPAYGFPGLNPGDHWCVCAARWLEAYEDGVAPPVRLDATESSTLQLIPLAVLQGAAAS
jgi:uncharacterized protein (DUF2237 family)